MTIFYLDASAWVKYYVVETGSQWVDKFWNLRLPCACSDLGLVEVIATLTRRNKHKAALSGSYTQAIRDVQQQFHAMKSVPLNAQVLANACQIAQTSALRGADSIHLASAQWVRDSMAASVTVIASDAELLAAASAEGFATLDPAIDPPLPVAP